MASEYTFYPKFEEYVTLFRGVAHMWIGNGNAESPENPEFPSYNDTGVLYAQYVNDDVQILGPITDYNYAAQQGFEGSFAEWVEFMLATAEHVVNAEKWATGGSGAQYTPGNSAKEQADRAAIWAAGNSSGNGSPTNNAKYYSEQASASATSAEQSDQQAEAWAVGTKNGVPVESGDPEYQNNAKYYGELSTSNAQAAHNSEINAKDSETKAKTSETNAKTSETNSHTSEVNAASSATAAHTSETNAANSAAAAHTSETNAATSETKARSYMGTAEQHKNTAELWATGGSDGTPSETNNAKYYAQIADRQAQKWAIGPGEDTEDETYENNAKYYSDHADSVVDDFTSTVTSAVTTYQNSQNGITHPDESTGWTPAPSPEKGKYLWAKTTFTWNDGHTTVMYTSSYWGMDGDGIVTITTDEIDEMFA